MADSKTENVGAAAVPRGENVYSGDAAIAASGASRTFVRQGRGAGRLGLKKQRDEFVALESVDLRINSGEFVALVGASGCGKTTLLNMLAGLVEPSAGEVTLAGKVPRCPNPDIGYMFARPALLPWRRTLSNVEFVLEQRSGWNRASRRARAKEVLDLVGLSMHERSFPLQLSQGMRQRASLARTLAPDPRILLMDEPFAAVDAQTKLTLQRQFLEIWEHASEHTKTTVVFVTHDLTEAMLLADRIVVMLPSPGRIASEHRLEFPRPRADRLEEIMFSQEFKELHLMMFNELQGAIGTPRSRPASPGREAERSHVDDGA